MGVILGALTLKHMVREDERDSRTNRERKNKRGKDVKKKRIY